MHDATRRHAASPPPTLGRSPPAQPLPHVSQPLRETLPPPLRHPKPFAHSRPVDANCLGRDRSRAVRRHYRHRAAAAPPVRGELSGLLGHEASGWASAHIQTRASAAACRVVGASEPPPILVLGLCT